MRQHFRFDRSSPTCHLGSHPRDDRDLFVLCCGFDLCRSDYRVERRNHPVHVIEYVYRGQGALEAEGRRWQLRGGMVFFYGPGTAHRYWTDPDSRMEKLWVVYAGSEARRYTGEVLGSTVGAFALASPHDVGRIAEAIAEEIINKTEHSQEICDAYLRALLHAAAANRVPDAPRDARAMQTFRACKSFIDSQFETIRSPFSACSRQHITASYLCRLFRRFAGNTPHAYLADLKLNSAAYELLTSSATVKQVATRLHFADQYTFSRAFKRHFGVAPLHYRQPLGKPPADRAAATPA